MGPLKILLIIALILLFLNPKRIAGFGRSIGEALRGFKKGLNNEEIDVTDSSKKGRRSLEGDDRS